MKLFGSFFSSGDEQLQEFIDTRKNKDIFPTEIPGIGNIFKSINGIEFYSSTPEFYPKLMRSIRNQDKLKLYRTPTLLVVAAKTKTIFIIFNNSTSLHDLLDFIKIHVKNESIKNFERKLKLAECEIKRSIELNSELIQQIKQKYQRILPFPHGIEFRINITPNKFIHEDKVKPIPKEYRETIEKFSIYIDPMGKINAIYCDGVHPNVKNGWYCLGDLQGQSLDLNTIDRIIAQLKIYNLNDCYYTPKGLIN